VLRRSRWTAAHHQSKLHAVALNGALAVSHARAFAGGVGPLPRQTVGAWNPILEGEQLRGRPLVQPPAAPITAECALSLERG
jgi:hypothetical protein